MEIKEIETELEAIRTKQARLWSLIPELKDGDKSKTEEYKRLRREIIRQGAFVIKSISKMENTSGKHEKLEMLKKTCREANASCI